MAQFWPEICTNLAIFISNFLNFARFMELWQGRDAYSLTKKYITVYEIWTRENLKWTIITLNLCNPLAAMAYQFSCAEPIYCNFMLN